MIFLCGVCQAELTVQQKQDCRILLDFAEKSTKSENWVYDDCGFADPDTAWYEWAPYVSQKQYPKALYQLCKRYPDHEYGPLYCTKAAQLNSVQAIYSLAKQAKKEKDYKTYESYLRDIIQMTFEDEQSLNASYIRQAYFELAQLYYRNEKDEKKRQNIIPYLQKSADMGAIKAASTLAILLYKNPHIDATKMYEDYLWKAIMKDCPAAEEFLGLMDMVQNKKISAKEFDATSNKLLFTCNPTVRTTPKKNWSKQEIESCACQELMPRVKLQAKKPFKIVSLSADKVVLQNRSGTQYTVSKGEKIADGYVLQDINPTAVKIAKQAVSTTLFYIDDECVDLCRDVENARTDVNKYKPYTLKFTPKECQKIAQHIETLEWPLDPFRGVQQCQIQDWKRWGEDAIKEKRNKHLFLLADYRDSDYIPSYIALAQLNFVQGGVQAYDDIAQLLSKAIQLKPNDEFSKQRQNYAYCLLGALYFGPLQDYYMAHQLLTKGSEDYASSSNMLGVAYANGWGVNKNDQKAKDYFEKALKQDDKTSDVSIDAAYNLEILKARGDVSQMQYGHCETLLDPEPLSAEEVLKIYKPKEVTK